MEYTIINVKDRPEYLERSINYFSDRWDIDHKIYENCITHSITTENVLPRWYILLKENEIVGGFSLLTNDFVSRGDLWPYLSALYVEETERGKALGSMLLEHGRKEAYKLGFRKVYLCTDHINYYEKYGWKCIGEGYHPWNEKTNIYEADAIS